MMPGRAIPPVAAPIPPGDLWNALVGIVRKEKTTRNLREDLGDFFGVKYVYLVSSGKAAFLLSLLALHDVLDRDEVVIPAYTCYSVPSSIVKAGLKVRLCDVHPETLDFDFQHLEKIVSSRTLCVVPIHLFGIPSDVDRAQSIASRHGAVIVEDAAQAMGGTSRGRKLGTLGDIGFFSLGRGKNITAGSGGILLTGSERWGQAIARQYRNWRRPGPGEEIATFIKIVLMKLFLDPRLYWIPESLPFLKLGETIFHEDFPCHRMGGAQAGLLRNFRERLGRYNHEHHAAAEELLRMLFGENGSGVRQIGSRRDLPAPSRPSPKRRCQTPCPFRAWCPSLGHTRNVSHLDPEDPGDPGYVPKPNLPSGGLRSGTTLHPADPSPR